VVPSRTYRQDGLRSSGKLAELVLLPNREDVLVGKACSTCAVMVRGCCA